MTVQMIQVPNGIYFEQLWLCTQHSHVWTNKTRNTEACLSALKLSHHKASFLVKIVISIGCSFSCRNCLKIFIYFARAPVTTLFRQSVGSGMHESTKSAYHELTTTDKYFCVASNSMSLCGLAICFHPDNLRICNTHKKQGTKKIGRSCRLDTRNQKAFIFYFG